MPFKALIARHILPKLSLLLKPTIYNINSWQIQPQAAIDKQLLCHPAAYNSGIIGAFEIKALNVYDTRMCKHIPQLPFRIRLPAFGCHEHIERENGRKGRACHVVI